MSYTVLARRYRSTTFDEVIGQEHIAQTLKRAIESGRIAHAFLFCGTRGTGKTTMARILAKALNCHKSKGPTTEPCGKCDSCLGIARGDDLDVIEIDAASNTQVEKTRDVIIENAQYRPAYSRFKIYIIDEAHMLSKQSFNALLKTMEEPPEHVKFILATTEPEKLLPTILSRCQRYDFRNIPTREIAGHLKNICKTEKIKADEDALLLVAKAGAGSMRDALSLLDRLLSIGETNLTLETIQQLLGMPRAQAIFDLAQAIGAGKVKEMLEQSSEMVAGGLSTDALLNNLIDHLRNLLVLRTCGKDSELVEVPGLPLDDLFAQAQQFNAIVLTQDIAILEELRRNIRSTQAGRPLFEATLVRLALAEQFTSIEELLDGVSAGPGAPEQKKNSEPRLKPAIEVAPITPPQPITPPPTADEDDDLPRPGKVWDNSGPSLAELLKEQESQRPAANIEPVKLSDPSTIWQSLLQALAAKGATLPPLLAGAKLIGIDDGKAIIRFSDPTPARMLERNGKKDVIQQELSALLNRNVGLSIEVDENQTPPQAVPDTRQNARVISKPAPAQPAPQAISNGVRLTAELKNQLRESNPLIAAIMTELGGEIVKVE